MLWDEQETEGPGAFNAIVDRPPLSDGGGDSCEPSVQPNVRYCVE